MTRSRLQTIRCASLLTPAGWRRDCVIQLNEKGRIESIVDDTAATAELTLTGLVIPGIPNLHSHAHQRAIVGLTEHRAANRDDFWGWREMMYRANAAINPDQLQDIARYLYIDMLRQGYTSVIEFHYLHHQPNGLPYQNPAEMSERLIAAADEAGIAITLLPVLYCRGGFQDEPLQATQKRFFHRTDDYLQLLQQCQSLCANHPDRSIGIAAHSLRAASPRDIQAVIEQAGPALSSAPVHIHIAEQKKEVEDCLQVNGVRPVDWLFDSCDLSERWCLIHATHISEAERSLITKNGVTVGLCPTTEANLGDGIFPAAEFLNEGGIIGIGSDSQVSVSPPQELRLLEYAQRLRLRKRTVLAPSDGGNNGRHLLEASVTGGRRAAGERLDSIAPGARGDLIEMASDGVEYAGLTEDQTLDAWIFSSTANAVRNVIVGGVQVVKDFDHAGSRTAAQALRGALSTLPRTLSSYI